MIKLLIYVNIFVVLSLAVVLDREVQAHGGGMDSNKCHVDSRSEQRHCHKSPKPQVLQGTAYRVTDGDTLRVLADGQRLKIRLSSIDCPEKAQPGGLAARDALADLVLDRQVRIMVLTRDRYRRHIGRVFIGEANINREMVRSGACWAYTRYLRDDAMPGLQAEARDARRGLWRDPSPVPPWAWRKQR